MENLFNKAAALSEAEQFLKDKGVEYTQRPDGTLYVPGSMAVANDEGLTQLPDLSCVIVGGDFWCSNTGITTLKGAPRHVMGGFYCAKSKLVSLEGAPETVGGGFYAANNEIASLQGGPRVVHGEFVCYNNALTSLEGLPLGVKSVDSDFGKFASRNDVPSDLIVTPKTIEEATVLQRDVRVRPLRLKTTSAAQFVF